MGTQGLGFGLRVLRPQTNAHAGRMGIYYIFIASTREQSEKMYQLDNVDIWGCYMAYGD